MSMVVNSLVLLMAQAADAAEQPEAVRLLSMRNSVRKFERSLRGTRVQLDRAHWRLVDLRQSGGATAERLNEVEARPERRMCRRLLKFTCRLENISQRKSTACIPGAIC